MHIRGTTAGLELYDVETETLTVHRDPQCDYVRSTYPRAGMHACACKPPYTRTSLLQHGFLQGMDTKQKAIQVHTSA
jgi:hypothetical protein